jgi:hypothetical protein
VESAPRHGAVFRATGELEPPPAGDDAIWGGRPMVLVGNGPILKKGMRAIGKEPSEVT